MSFRIQAYDNKLGKDLEGETNIFHQIYGNNEFPERLREYLVSKGVELDEDDCFQDYEIIDLQEFLEVMLEIHNGMVEDDSYWDMKPTLIKTDTVDGLVSHCEYKIDNSIVFIMYNFVKAFDDFIERYWDDGIKYKIKAGKHIYLAGF